MNRSPMVLVALIGGALLAGYAVGTWQAGPSVHVGRADSTAEGGGSIETADWTYGFGRDVAWRSADGVWHVDGPPDCLPPSSSVEGVTFGAIDTPSASGIRPVLWIDCGSVVPGR
jgi:hypothetical protein